MTSDKVPFGYRQVTSAEKKRLVREQFDPIAPTYDLADTLLSFGRDSRWRKTAIDLLGLEPGGLVLDACGGTAVLARLAARRVGPAGRVVVYDFNRPMMDAGLKKIRSDSGTAADSDSGSVSAMAAAAADAETDRGRILFVQGDAEQLSFLDATFDAVTIGFGLRNLVHPERGLAEFLRVLKPGGKLMVLEFSLPVNPVFRRLYHFYSFRWMPFVAKILWGTGGPFRYLAESIRVYPGPEEIAALMSRAGFGNVRYRRLTNGIAVVHLAAKT